MKVHHLFRIDGITILTSYLRQVLFVWIHLSSFCSLEINCSTTSQFFQFQFITEFYITLSVLVAFCSALIGRVNITVHWIFWLIHLLASLSFCLIHFHFTIQHFSRQIQIYAIQIQSLLAPCLLSECVGCDRVGPVSDSSRTSEPVCAADGRMYLQQQQQRGIHVNLITEPHESS